MTSSSSSSSGGDQQTKTSLMMEKIMKRILIFDVFGSSRETRVMNGTDNHGHHYEGTVMESMTQQFLSLMCPTTKFTSLDSHSREKYHKFLLDSFLETSKLSCDRMEKLKLLSKKKKTAKIEMCSCGDSEAVKSKSGKEYCAELKR